jgi:L-alanine-DL-glutamate epimerase-like enolase superfamily enzyme
MPRAQHKHISLSWTSESIALAKPFKISRGTKNHADVVVLTITLDDKIGWAEAVPYARYEETIESTIETLQSVSAIISSLSNNDPLLLVEEAHSYINEHLIASSAKNLLDCALWDLKAKVCQTTVNDLVSLPSLTKVVSAQTLSVDTLDIMLKDAKTMVHLPLIKIKLDAVNVVEKMRAIANVCPNSRFIIDANESWSFSLLKTVVNELANLHVALIEQPLPASQDDELIGFKSPIPLCADESCHTSTGISVLERKYDMVNIKLDKTGGLTEAIKLANAAKAANMQIMLGCMVASSLAMAPIFVLVDCADYIDLDGPVLVLQDRPNGFIFTKNTMQKPRNLLWGQGCSENTVSF